MSDLLPHTAWFSGVYTDHLLTSHNSAYVHTYVYASTSSLCILEPFVVATHLSVYQSRTTTAHRQRPLLQIHSSHTLPYTQLGRLSLLISKLWKSWYEVVTLTRW